MKFRKPLAYVVLSFGAFAAQAQTILKIGYATTKSRTTV